MHCTVAALHTALQYRTRLWTKFMKMHCTCPSTSHYTQIQNKILNSIQRDALYLLQHSPLHSNTEQDAELNSGRCTVPVPALHTALKYRTRYWTQFRKMHCACRNTPHCTWIYNKILHSIQEDVLHLSQHSLLHFNTNKYLTQFGKMHCTCRCTPHYTQIQNKILNSIQEDALYLLQHSTLHSNTEQNIELDSGRCTVHVAALHTTLKYRIRY